MAFSDERRGIKTLLSLRLMIINFLLALTYKPYLGKVFGKLSRSSFSGITAFHPFHLKQHSVFLYNITNK